MHASHLHPMISTLLQETGYTLSDLNAIAISMGPGSYTGLRVGVSAAKGLAYTLQIPLIAINTLQALSNRFVRLNGPQNAMLVPMIDARRLEVYTAIYNSNAQEIMATQAKIIDEQAFHEELNHHELIFFGNGSEKCRDLIKHPNASFHANFTCGASGLLSLAQEAYQNKAFENLAYFEPYYLKDFVGTTPKSKK